MAREYYGYFDCTETDDRPYVADEFAELSRARGGTGVNDGLAVSTAGGMKVAVSPGHAFIDGYMYALIADSTGAKELTLGVAGSAARIDRVVLRLDLSAEARNIKLAVKEGTPAASPAPPALTKNDLIKEISLCRVLVPASASSIAAGNLTDERLDSSVCGVAIPPQLSAAGAARLTTARTIRTNLASTSAASFDGTANVTPGVTGVLGSSNGGLGVNPNSAENRITARKTIGLQIARGNVDITAQPYSNGSAEVVFPAGLFTSPPYVYTTIAGTVSARELQSSAGDRTTEGVTIYLGNNTANAVVNGVVWLAVYYS